MVSILQDKRSHRVGPAMQGRPQQDATQTGERDGPICLGSHGGHETPGENPKLIKLQKLLGNPSQQGCGRSRWNPRLPQGAARWGLYRGGGGGAQRGEGLRLGKGRLRCRGGSASWEWGLGEGLDLLPGL